MLSLLYDATLSNNMVTIFDYFRFLPIKLIINSDVISHLNQILDPPLTMKQERLTVAAYSDMQIDLLAAI